ncbi:MAG TPA: hydroxyisourate hydrolase [Myxococcota bacterium]|jgi:5-hydroxyisourate hydrolase|nr:hydroxyisourate hydrolase [Myxococcota bacterium]
MSAITTHVLDVSRGRPAAGVPVVLRLRAGDATGSGGGHGGGGGAGGGSGRGDGGGAPRELGRGVTDADGRLRTLLPDAAPLAAGVYELTFDVGAYHAALGVEGFYPEATIVFAVRDPGGHYHVPLLLSPFGYSTYRGS